MSLRICLLGFGEVGQRVATDLRGIDGLGLVAWDRLFPTPTSVPARAAQSRSIELATNLAAATSGADVVISAVTAAQSLSVASESAPHMAEGAFFLDLNSVSPATKIACAAAHARGAGRYVEAAVMSPIQPLGAASPILLGGPHATAFMTLAQTLGFSALTAYSPDYGKAAAAKMTRSVMIKGLEALIAESLLTARHFGVEQDVLRSLANLMPGIDWTEHARYMLVRSLHHGVRRAEEIREAAATVRAAGVDSWMSEATALRQDWAAARVAALPQASLDTLLDAVLAQDSVKRAAWQC
jgi:3-hydroxyisobutyrate dehydrogenase-like beta-hydroxyacid dehydrogenase